MRRLLALVAPAAAIVAGAIVLRDSAVAARLVLTGGLVYAALVAWRSVRGRWAAAGPSPFEAALRRPAAVSGEPAAVRRLESAITLSTASAAGFDHHLRPTLERVAAARLAARGVRVEEDPEAARAALGDEAWELLRPRERRVEEDRAGPPQRRIETVVARIEEIA